MAITRNDNCPKRNKKRNGCFKITAVYGQKNSVIGNILCADIKLAKGAFLDIPQIRNFLADKLQPFKIPRKITFVESLKQTATGKLKR